MISESWDLGEVGLPGRQLPARLGRVERPLPRPRPRLRQGRRRHRRRLRPQLPRLRRHLRPARAAAVGEHQLHHRARRLHPRRPLRLQREAQRGERRGQPRRPRRQPLVELRRRGADRRPGDPRAARPDAPLRDDDARRQPGRADDADGRRERPHPARQQQRLLPGQRARLDGLEPRAARGRRSSPSSPARCGCAASWRCSPRRTGSAARRSARAARPGVRWLRPDGAPMRQAGMDQRPRQGARGPARRRRRRRGAGARRTPRSSTSSFVLPDPARRPAWRLRLDSGSGEIDPDDAAGARPATTVAVPARSMRLYSL